MDRRELRVLRIWLGLQVLASVAANQMGADQTWEARVVALPAPLILFGSIESMLRIPGGRDLLSITRAVTTAVIGGAAAFLSFATIGHLGAIAGLTVLEQVALVVILDGGMLVVALTLLMVSRMNRPARKARKTTPPPAPQAPAPVADVEEPDGLNEELTTEDRRDLVLTRVNAGDTAPEIAELTGAHIRTIRRDIAGLREAGRLPKETAAA